LPHDHDDDVNANLIQKPHAEHHNGTTFFCLVCVCSSHADGIYAQWAYIHEQLHVLHGDAEILGREK
jgi:hypothetical protein